MLLTIALSAAIAAAVRTEKLADGCSAAEAAQVVKTADAQRLGSVNGRDVALISLHGSCVCGNVNCPWLVVDAGGSPAVLLSTYAFAIEAVRAGERLPRLREHAHDSALITDESLDVYRGGRYIALETARVRGDSGKRKPNNVPVRFAPGTSAARLHGSVSFGWYDSYAFDAARGQRLTIGDLHSRAKISVMLFGPGNAQPIDVTNSPVTLDRSGTFALQVEMERDGEDDVPYALTLSIR